MSKSTQHRLFNLFAFALLAFAIYLTVFKKEEEESPTNKPARSGAFVNAHSMAMQAQYAH